MQPECARRQTGADPAVTRCRRSRSVWAHLSGPQKGPGAQRLAPRSASRRLRRYRVKNQSPAVRPIWLLAPKSSLLARPGEERFEPPCEPAVGDGILHPDPGAGEACDRLRLSRKLLYLVKKESPARNPIWLPPSTSSSSKTCAKLASRRQASRLSMTRIFILGGCRRAPRRQRREARSDPCAAAESQRLNIGMEIRAPIVKRRLYTFAGSDESSMLVKPC